MTILFRSAKDCDLDSIHHLAELSGIGMTTLSKEINVLKKRLYWSTQSFKKKVTHPKNEYYLFVLEDTTNQKIIGTSAIEASLGHECHFYSYKISKQTQVCDSLNIQNDYELLNLVTDNHGCSELCTLFLDPTYRHSGNGLLLSRSRFLFMSGFPERFQPSVIAEMRGICDENGESPFWNAIGHHFFHMPFAEADRITSSTNKQFIADLMPKHPVYVNLLPQVAQDVIGKTHPLTEAALTILLHEGFHHTPYIDIFDAGPTIAAQQNEIRSITENRLLTVTHIDDNIKGDPVMLANTQIDFRATISSIHLDEPSGHCAISKETADLMQIHRGDKIRVMACKS